MQLRQPNRSRRAVPAMVPAPVGGLNARDSYAEMPATDAFQMDNWFPYNTSVDTRGGSLDFATGFGNPIESLEVYTAASSTKMFAFAGGNVYDVSAGGAAGTPLLTGRSSNKIQSCMFSNAGVQALLMFSGNDAPLWYNGTTLAALAITGLTGSQNTLYSPMAFKGRVYLAQQGQLGFYYLGVGAIQGAASYFDLSQQCLKGGGVAAIVSASVADTGVGPQDYAVFATTEGEYVIYSGTDPSNAANWGLVSRYYGPAPIGPKCWFKFRSDVYFITEEGILSLTEIRQLGDDNEDSGYITSKLGRAFTDLTSQYKSVQGWCGMLYPRGNALYVNMPMTSGPNGPYCQYVMNTNTNAWTRYLGLNALCWALFNRTPYFGTYDGRITQADTGFTDNGTPVNAVCRQAWNTFEGISLEIGQANKQFHFAAFTLAADGAPALACALNADFEDDQPSNTTSITPTPGATWDTATWDVDSWAGGAATQTLTVPVGKFGFTASIWMQAQSPASTVRWFATRVTLEKSNEVLI
jgi:hypothetical protein